MHAIRNKNYKFNPLNNTVTLYLFSITHTHMGSMFIYFLCKLILICAPLTN